VNTSITSTLACVAAFMTASACGSKKPPATVPTQEPSSIPAASGDNMESAETLDSIKTALDRKRSNAARCLSAAVDSKELPRTARGKMILGFMISADGKATDIKVIKTNLESPALATCVIDIVSKIQFATLSQAREWSYTYAFEAM
jgi:hypothetical protein